MLWKVAGRRRLFVRRRRRRPGLHAGAARRRGAGRSPSTPPPARSCGRRTIAPGLQEPVRQRPAQHARPSKASRVYVQSVTGPLVCLEADDGTIVWQNDLLKEFGAKNITWGLSASPLIEGDLVLAIPGGKGAGVAAFDKKTGKLVWKTGDDKAAYASPVARHRRRAAAGHLLHRGRPAGASTRQGKELWRVPWKTEFDCNICTPLVVGDQLFVSSGEKVGCALFKLKADGAARSRLGEQGQEERHDQLLGQRGRPRRPPLRPVRRVRARRIDLNCVELKTGKLMWSKKDFGKGAVTLADGHLFITTKKGDLVLVPATPKKYEEKARVTLAGREPHRADDRRTSGCTCATARTSSAWTSSQVADRLTSSTDRTHVQARTSCARARSRIGVVQSPTRRRGFLACALGPTHPWPSTPARPRPSESSGSEQLSVYAPQCGQGRDSSACCS